jgi:transcriptional regulator with XRE-family HTH domain
MAEGDWTNRKLSRETEAAGRRLAPGSIGNIARGEDTATPQTLEHLARTMGCSPDVFLEVQLARARRLFDERIVGLEVAHENYKQLAEAFPDV